MKVAISTIIDQDNYGNRLQNYANQEILKSIGVEAVTLYTPDDIETRYRTEAMKRPVNELKRRMRNTLFSMLAKLPVNNEKLNFQHRHSKFVKFTNKHINQTPVIVKGADLSALNEQYDYFLTGSDQVWNHTFRFELEKDFLTFADPHKRIAYSPSFGVSELPEILHDKYRTMINEMASLSVREHAGANIIKQLTGKEADVLIDPTMMLSSAKWREVATKPVCLPKKKYILTYVLGTYTASFKQFLEELKTKQNLEVINLLDKKNRDTYAIDPAEFVYLIDHAEVMVTDSFHGAVFSIIMKTPFVIFERQDNIASMNSRIETLTKTFNLESRLSSNIKTVEDVYNINFDAVHSILKQEQEKSRHYLKRALKLEN